MNIYNSKQIIPNKKEKNKELPHARCFEIVIKENIEGVQGLKRTHVKIFTWHSKELKCLLRRFFTAKKLMSHSTKNLDMNFTKDHV